MAKAINRALTEADTAWLNEPFSTSGAIAAVRSLMKQRGHELPPTAGHTRKRTDHPEVVLRRDKPGE